MIEDTEVPKEEIIEEQLKAGLLEKLNAHKFKILAGVLGILVLTGAVFGAYKLGQKQVQPGSQPTPSPTVTCGPCPQFMPPHPDFCKDGTLIPGGEDECGCQGPPRCQSSTADWNTYTAGILSLKYPPTWFVKETTSVFFVFLPSSSTPSNAAPISLDTRLEKTYEQSVQDHKENLVQPKEESVSVGRKPATRISGRVGPGFGEGTFVISVIINYRGKAVSFNYSWDEAGIYQQTFDLMLSTFKFLGSEGSSEGKFVCPKGDSIDCMPIVEGEAKWFCSKEYLNWARKNCPKFIITY